MWRELRSTARKGLLLPEIVGDRCVHALTEKASCRACVDACPRDAWIIDEDMLGIDVEKCDGCDLCVPVCPQGAIRGRFSPSLKATDRGGFAFAACEYADLKGRIEGLMPCLHSIGMSELLQLRLDGASFLVTSCGACESCERGGVKRLEQRLDGTNRLLASRGLGLLRHRSLVSDAWDEALRRIGKLAASRTLDRRAFFRRAVGLPGERVEAAVEDVTDSYLSPGMLLGGDGADPLFPYVPVFHPAHCNGCDACVLLCPNEAIGFDAQERQAPAYVVRAERCTGCGICTDVCHQDAVTVKKLGRSLESRVPLRVGRCRVCGVDFHVPACEPDAEQVCWVCRKTSHRNNLYQVLD
jgi:ferredoxin